MQTSIKEERRKAEADYLARLAEALALFAAGDCVVPPSSSRLTAPTPAQEPTERYVWTGELRNWFAPLPSTWLSATSVQEAAYLEHWRQCALTKERADAKRLMQREHEEEKERRARAGAA